MKRLLFLMLVMMSISCGCFAQMTDDEKYEQADKYYNAKEYSKAIPILNELATRNHAKALNRLGGCYYFGYGVPKDKKIAVSYFEKSANLGLSTAQRNLGSCYEFGNGNKKDLDKAVEWYMKAAENDNEYAMCRLGWIYLENEEYRDMHTNDYGWDYILKQAEKWFRLAAKKDSPEGIFGLACFYFLHGDQENDIERQIEKATPLFAKAAEKGHSSAQLFMGCEELRNDNVSSAKEWFEKAVKNGDDSFFHGATGPTWLIVSNFLIAHPEYNIHWEWDCCTIDFAIYPHQSDVYIGVVNTKTNSLGFYKLSQTGKVLAHTPIIYSPEMYAYSYDEENNLFHVRTKDDKEIVIDITGKEIKNNN